MTFKKEDVMQAFFAAGLEEDYNFLQEDLVKLADAIIAKAAPKIAREERRHCVQFVQSLNHLLYVLNALLPVANQCRHY